MPKTEGRMTDATYYARRAAQEKAAAERSACVEARRIHEALATRYAALSEAGTMRLAA